MQDDNDATYLRCYTDQDIRDYPNLGGWNEVTRSTLATALNFALRRKYQKSGRYYEIAIPREFEGKKLLHPVFCRLFRLLESGFLDRSCLAYKVYVEAELSPFKDGKLFAMDNDIYYYMLPCSSKISPQGVGYYKDNIWTLFYIYAGL